MTFLIALRREDSSPSIHSTGVVPVTWASFFATGHRGRRRVQIRFAKYGWLIPAAVAISC